MVARSSNGGLEFFLLVGHGRSGRGSFWRRINCMKAIGVWYLPLPLYPGFGLVVAHKDSGSFVPRYDPTQLQEVNLGVIGSVGCG